jgi:LexA-binding, inner membrane-associated putative hydrolase
MPDMKTHKFVGAASGAVYAAYKAGDHPNVLIEAIGGGFGGYWASMLPDVLEPATSSWHRGPCHSFTAGGVVMSASSVLTDWATACRQEADKHRATEMAWNPATGSFTPMPQNPFQLLAEWFWSFLAGLLNGLGAGYLSHIALDAFTPRGVPFVGAAAV